MPPSPTGFLQVGNMRTFLFNYLYAKKHGGRIVLRIEDTDKERSTKEFEDAVYEDLAWLGITYDEQYRQSDRSALHRHYLEKLIEAGAVYISPEAAERGKRSEVLRFKNPNRTVAFHDAIRGEISMDTSDLGDFVVAKDMDTPLYHLAVTIDDHEMRVTHIIRGEDHISNTPRQILILEALGATVPEYAHLPLMLAENRSKLSKRNGSVSIRELRREGYLPAAIINTLAMIGWTPAEGQEYFSVGELIEKFDLAKLHMSGAVWNIEKLRWFNRHYLRQLAPEDASRQLRDYLPGPLKEKAESHSDLWNRLAPTLLERVSYFGEVVDLAGKGEVMFFFDKPLYEHEDLLWKGTGKEVVVKHLQWVRGAVDNSDQHDYTVASISAKIMPYADENGRGAVLWPMRYALSGQKRSPDPFTIAYILGRGETLARLDVAIKKLQDA